MSETLEIELTRGQIAVVDAADHLVLEPYKWCATLAPSGIWYAVASQTCKPRTIYMHRLIMDAGPGQQIDHVDGNGLNNRRANLRFATEAQNAWNSRRSRTNTSGLKGVNYHPRRGLWRATLRASGKSLHLGYFDTPEQAAVAYNDAVYRLRGEFARPATVEPSPRHHTRSGPVGLLRGEAHPAAKLNVESVRAIRQRAAMGESKERIARAFGVNPRTITFIVRGETWRHVD